MKAWHFSNNKKTLGYGDNRKIILGKTLSVGCSWKNINMYRVKLEGNV